MGQGSTRIAPTGDASQALADRQLVAALRGSDELASHAAFRVIAETYSATIMASAGRLLRDLDAADDVTQTVLFALWKGRATLRLQTTLRAYLIRAAYNTAYNVQRAQAVANAGLADFALYTRTTEDNDGLTGVLVSDTVQCIEEVLAATSSARRRAFELYFLEGLTQQECAEVLGVTKQTVKLHINHVNQRLRVALAARGVEAA